MTVLSGGVAAIAPAAGPLADAARVQQQMGAFAVPFLANAGQDDPRVAFTARSQAGTLFVTREGKLVYSFPGNEIAAIAPAVDRRSAAPARGPGWTLTETLVDARPRPRGAAASAVGVSRFIGSDPARWRSDVPTFDRVSLGEAWPGIDVALAAHGRNVEKWFTVAPGANARRIAIRIDGARRLVVDADGTLVAHTGNGPIAFAAPVAWQDIDGLRQPVEVAYAVSCKRYGFRLGAHERAHPVVIDPMVEFTYLGGNGDDFLWAIAPDASGNVFVTGYTLSSNFPGTAGGAQPVSGANTPDAFIAKLDPALTLVQASYYGGGLADYGYAVAVASTGDVFVAGFTNSTNLPGTAGGAQAASGGGNFDGYVAKFSADLKTLQQATYVGSNGFDTVRAMRLDANDNVFVAGATNAPNYPGTAGGAQSAFGGGGADVVVVKLSSDLKTRIQSTYAGGGAIDQPYSMAISAAGFVYVAGATNSSDFPVTAGAAQTTFGGGANDAFIVKLANDLKSMPRSSFVGGSGEDIGWGVAVAPNGDVLVAGGTFSANLPGVAGGYQTTYAGAGDGFVAAFNAELAGPGRATYLGGAAFDEAHAVAVDPLSGHVVVVGQTSSPNLQASAGALKGFDGDIDGFIFEVALDLIHVFGWEYVGGISRDELWDLAFERWVMYVMGSSTSTAFAQDGGAYPSAGEARAPKMNRKLQPTNGGGFDGIIARVIQRNYQGLWWNSPPGSEAGWGINFAHQGDTIFATWFTYGADGKPLWIAMSAARTTGDIFAGDLFTTTGPPFNAAPFDPATVVETTVGSGTLAFTSATAATFTYTVNGITQSKTITRQEFATPVPGCIWGAQSNLAATTNFQDLWWRSPPGSEAGWGINFTHQGNVIFATWFTYGPDGKPLWLAVAANLTAPGVFSGDLFTTSGPPFSAVPFNPTLVVETTVGTATITFTDGNTATFAYTVNGEAQTKTITRQVFAEPGTSCQ